MSESYELARSAWQLVDTAGGIHIKTAGHLSKQLSHLRFDICVPWSQLVEVVSLEARQSVWCLLCSL